MYVGDGRALTRMRNGHWMYVPSRDMSLGPWLMIDGTWEKAVTSVFTRAVRPGMTVVDVGANVGWFTLLAARLVGPRGLVVAFEPDPQLFDMLADNVELNGYEHHVQLHRAALADVHGSAPFHAATRHRGNGSLVPALNQLGDASAEIVTYDVTLTTLDALQLPSVDVMKVDAEGAEPRVFRGARDTVGRSPALTAIVEFWPIFFTRAGEDPRAFLDARRREGFELRQIDGRSGRTKRVRDEDVLERGAYELLFRRR